MWKFPLFQALASFGQPPARARAANSRPLSRHRRNPKDPHQAARIKAAQMKRSRKEERRCLTTAKSFLNNPTILRVLPLSPLSPMEQMDQEIAAELKEIGRRERAVMRQVRGLVRRRVYADIVKYMHEDSDWVGDLRIDDTHGGEEVDLNEYAFKRAFIYQTVNGGYSGDDYAGHIWIPLNAGKYLHFHYSC